MRFSTPNESAQGDSGIYNVDDGTIRLVGNVVLTSGQSVIRGSEAIMNLETGKARCSARPAAMVVSRASSSLTSRRNRTIRIGSAVTDVLHIPFAQAKGGPLLVADNVGLVAENLAKSYQKRPVLRNVSIAVQRGEAVGLLGPNGAGKTTCFYIITGLISADAGAISLDGNDITELPMYRRARLGIGYLPQESLDLPRHDGRGQYPRGARGRRKGSWHARAHA